jgi:hypothetical protein
MLRASARHGTHAAAPYGHLVRDEMSLMRPPRSFRICALLLLFAAERARALPRYGPLEITGNVSAQQLIRHPDIDEYAFVQQRNTLRLRVDYQMFDQGKLIGQFTVPGISQVQLHLLYRGVYDSVYDYTPGFEQKDIYGHELTEIPGDLPDRLDDIDGDSVKFENRLREAYLDIRVKSVPFTLRLGRQQIVWGETDNFRLLDRINALDLTWHLQQETWDELRIPYWMIKGLYNIGRVGPLSDAFFEFFWNPGDWYPAKRAFLPRPWSVPLKNPFARLNELLRDLGALPDDAPTRLADQTKPFRQGDYHRNPWDNSQVGARVSAVTPQGVQFTLNYFYQRWSGDDGTNSAPVEGLTKREAFQAALDRGELPLKFIAPYVHAAGLSLNYADEYTDVVFRAETIYEFGVPFTDASKPVPDPILGRDIFGISKHDMWKGMIGFDRPTWIRFLNRRSTFLLTGQFFWHYLVDNPDIECGDPREKPPCARSNQTKGLRGQFSSSGLLWGPPVVIDRVRDWELLATIATTTFYQGGKIVPFLAYVIDPVNKYNMEVLWAVDYYFTPNFIINLSQRFFVNTTSEPVYESWGLGGINRGRSETGIRFTYQF